MSSLTLSDYWRRDTRKLKNDEYPRDDVVAEKRGVVAVLSKFSEVFNWSNQRQGESLTEAVFSKTKIKTVHLYDFTVG